MRDNLEGEMRHLARNILAIRMLHMGLQVLSALFFGWGVVVLALRRFSALSLNVLLFSGVVLALAGCLGVVLVARRSGPRLETLCARIDQQCGMGGLLMAAATVPLDDWAPRIAALSLPRPVWNGRPALLLFAAAALFAALAISLPVKPVHNAIVARFALDAEIRDLERKIELLRDQDILGVEESRELLQSIERIAQQAKGDRPENTWEALDHTTELLYHEAAKAAQETAAGLEGMNALQAAAHTLEKSIESMPRESAAAMKELAAMPEEMAPALPRTLMNHPSLSPLRQGAASTNVLRQLAADTRQIEQQQLDRLSRLSTERLLNQRQAAHLQEQAGRDMESLLDWLERNPGCTNLAKCVQAQSGQGSIMRGRGDAPLTWQDGSDENSARFQERILPSASSVDLENSQTLGESAAAPTPPEETADIQPGPLDNVESRGGHAEQIRILPRHTRSVDRYFNRGRHTADGTKPKPDQ